MSAADDIAALTVFCADRLTEAAEADHFSDHAEHRRGIEAAAEVLHGLTVHLPTGAPYVTAMLGEMTPRIRPGDLFAACHFAESAIGVEATGPLLHPDCYRWTLLACRDHDGATVRTVLAVLACEMAPTGITRPSGLPLSESLRDSAGSAMWADLEAARTVREYHIGALGELAEQIGELLGLVADGIGDGTLAEAVDALEGRDRVTAEELSAAGPSVVLLEGGV